MSALGPEQIKEILPHRAPMLLIDRVTELVADEQITASKAISLESPWYTTCSGSDYGFPRSLLIESFAQAAAILVATRWREQGGLDDQVPIFGSMSGARFGPPVLPGDLLEHRVRMDRILGDSAIFGGTSTVNDVPVLTVDSIIVALRPSRLLDPSTRRQHCVQL